MTWPREEADTPHRSTATDRANAGSASTRGTVVSATVVSEATLGARTGRTAADNEAGQLLRRLRRRQQLSRRRLSERVQRISGDMAINPDRLRQWEVGKDVPDRYWRGWLALALGIQLEVLDRAAVITEGRRRSRSRVRAAARGRPYPARSC